ncbi:MAG: PadR family transcriptional regulator [Bacteroidetes bacterium]|nr:PadR family transcriptional regulator [Bacteroidota bacterium]
MKLISRAEEIILTAILLLEGNAYGITIRDHILKVTGHEWSFASIYSPLDKLKQKGFVEKELGGATQERGGRNKYLYVITETGKEALREIRGIQNTIWGEINPSILD